MAIKYSVLIGHVLGGNREDKDKSTPHYTLLVDAGGKTFRAPVNVQSQDGSEILFFYSSNYKNDGLLKSLSQMGHGIHGIHGNGPGNSLDYVRGKVFTRKDMKSLPASKSGPVNDVQDIVERLVSRSKSQRGAGAAVYIFGEEFPGGIHDIHMNQGNTKNWEKDNGIWQDGGLIFYFPTDKKYEALFFGFQNQCWDTVDSGKKAGCCKK